jgi:hypothetical protein
MRPRTNFLDYVQAAFRWHWNLLALGAGAVFAVLSGQPDVVLPLLMAAELAYLGLLGSNPRFQKAVAVRKGKAAESPEEDQAMLGQIRGQVNPETWARFEALRNRCRALGHIAEQIRGPRAGSSARTQDLQSESLERLLWMFLKLVYSHDAVQRFLRSTDRNRLATELENARKELQTATARERSEKLLRSFEDTIKTLEQRIANYDQAQENRELLAAEIVRIEQKVNAVSEMAISARDPADISAQVDGIAEGVSATEEAMRKLDVAPLFERERTPRLLDHTG